MAISTEPVLIQNPDQLRELAKGGKEWIASYQRQQMDETGIQNLKVGYKQAFWVLP